MSITGGGFFSVDVFFFLSGFLCSYPLLQKMYPAKGKINVPMTYFHRYYRLIFPILAVTLFMSSYYKYIGDGPMWPAQVESQRERCHKYWWSNVLFI